MSDLGATRRHERCQPAAGESTMASRVLFRGSRAAAALVFAAAIAVGGCGGSGASTPGASTGAGGGNGGAGGTSTTGGAVVTDACSLLTAADVQGVIGTAVSKTEPYTNGPKEPGCTWSWGDGSDNVSIQLMSPGGKADFDSNRAFIGSFDAGLSSAMPSLVASAGNLFQQTDLSGLGDAAFMGPGYVLFVVKGDTEFKVQPGFIDSDVQGKLVKLAKIAVGHI
jgi:hypothetical protein